MNLPNLADERKDYLRARLLESDTPSYPMPLFDAWMKDALEGKLEDATAMALATCVDNRPSCRIVLLKGTQDESFFFYTNYASRKGEQLERNPYAAATFFWVQLERQVRIEGYVRKTSRENSAAYFASRPLESQISSAVSPQSQPVDSRDTLEELYQEKAEALQGQPPALPEHWGGYELVTERIEFWQGGSGRMHDRILYEKQGTGWTKTRLAP